MNYTLNRAQNYTIVLVYLHVTAEEIQSGHSQGSATATVATISTLLVILVIIIGIYITVQISYKIVHRKKRQAQVTILTHMH